MAITDQRSLGSLLADIAGDIQQILRGEMRLAKAEVVDSLLRLKAAVVLLGFAAIFGVLALTYLLLGAVYALAMTLPLWAAALIVAGLVSLFAAVCAFAGMKRIRSIRGAPRTAQSIRETLQWPTT